MSGAFAHASRIGARTALALFRDRQLVFWNFGFFTLLLVLFLGVLSRGDAALKVTLTTAIVTLGVMANALFGLGVGLATAREQGIFRRFAVTPLSGWTVLGGIAVARGLFVFTAALAQVVIARLFFGVAWSGGSLSVAAMLAFGTLAFSAIGLAVCAVAPAPRFANALVNLVLVPMMALGGGALPLSMLPPELSSIGRLLPVAALVSGLDASFVAGAGLPDLAPQALLLMIWSAAAGLIVAVRWPGNAR